MPTIDAAHSVLPSRPVGKLLVACGSAALLALLVYANMLSNPFVYDDHRVILGNPSLGHLANWRGILVQDMTRPLVNLSYALDYAIWGGPSPLGFHLTNLALHVLNVVLLFRLALLLGLEQWEGDPKGDESAGVTAMTASVLFAVHPALSQAVGYVSSRAEVLCTTWFLLAFLAARRALRDGAPRWWVVSTAAWLAALATKETAVVFPVVLGCYDYFVGRTSAALRRRRLLTLYGPLAVLGVLAAAVRLIVLARLEHPSGVAVQWMFGLIELDVFRRYLALLLMPVGQTVFHAIAPIHSLATPRAALAVLIAGGYALLAIYALRVSRAAGLGLTWFALVILPSAVLVLLDQGEPMAEHRIYLASAGLFVSWGVGVAALGARLRTTGPRVVRVAQTIAVMVVIALSMRTLVRNAVWSRPVTLWLEAAEYAPDHWLPRLALGEALHEEGRHEEAIAFLRSALVSRPQEALAYGKLGQCLLETGRIGEANQTFQTLLELDPRSPIPYGGLGMVAAHAGDPDLARRYFLEALAVDPRNVATRQVLASLEDAANPREALRMCEEIQQLAPETPGNEECIRRNRARLDANAEFLH